MNCISGKTSAFPHQGALLGHESGYLATHKLVGSWFAAVGVRPVGVRDIPGSCCISVVLRGGLTCSGQLGSLGVKGVTVEVLLAANRCIGRHRIGHEDGVVRAVDVGVNAKAEEMLVVLGVDSGVDLCTPTSEVLVGVHGISVENAGEFDLRLNCSILL